MSNDWFEKLFINEAKTALSKHGGAAPNISASDNGKLVHINNGKMEAAAVADTEVKNYVDNYISSALGGDY